MFILRKRAFTHFWCLQQKFGKVIFRVVFTLGVYLRDLIVRVRDVEVETVALWQMAQTKYGPEMFPLGLAHLEGLKK